MRTEFVPFLMAGDPNLIATEAHARALLRAGVRTLELGMPYSDPLADGPVLQRSAARSLSQGTRLAHVLELAARLVASEPSLRIVLFTYYNPLRQLGLSRFARAAKASGIAATLAVDLSFEEAGAFRTALGAEGLGTVFLASPTTSTARLAQIGAAASPFTYYVSRVGTTGARAELPPSLPEELARLRSIIPGPLAVGFGISTPAQVGALAPHAHYIVVGSRLVSLVEEAPSLASAELALARFASDCLNEIAKSKP